MPRQSYSLYEKGATASSPSLFSHSATYTLLSHTAPCTNSSCTCISLAQEKKKKSTTHASVRASHSSHSLSLPCTYTHIWQRVTSCRDGTARSCSLLLWFFLFWFFLLSLQNRRVKRFLLSPAVPPPPSSHKYPLWVLYEPILFSPTRSQRCHGHVLLSL